MTRIMHWSATLWFGATTLLPIGCSAKDQATRPSSRLLLPAAMEGGGEAHAAAALLAADQATGQLAGTLHGIEMARAVVRQNMSNADMLGFKRTIARCADNGKLTLLMDWSQGSMENTARDWDLGIQGEGLYKIQLPANQGSPPGVGYTRNGNFTTNSKGELLVNMGTGYALIPPITIPPGCIKPTVGTDGAVSVIAPGSRRRGATSALPQRLA